MKKRVKAKDSAIVDQELDAFGGKACALGDQGLASGIDVGGVDNQHRAPKREVKPRGVGCVRNCSARLQPVYASGEDPRGYLMLQSSGVQDLSVSIASARVRPRRPTVRRGSDLRAGNAIQVRWLDTIQLSFANRIRKSHLAAIQARGEFCSNRSHSADHGRAALPRT